VLTSQAFHSRSPVRLAWWKINVSALVCLCICLTNNPAFSQDNRTTQSTPEIPAAPVSETARTTLTRVRNSVVQIKGLFGANVAQAFHGTGFAVAAGGLLLSNYHVVAEHVLYPNKYRLEYRTPDGTTGKVTVLDIDVEHDLSLLRAEGLNLPPLSLRLDIPSKGERAFSIGFPLDVGLTITEGVLNGQVEDSFESRLHYSGAINGGMSGGPALDALGKVIGVNVSGYRFEQLVSFLVPAEHAQRLIDRAKDQPLDLKQARQEVARQLRNHADKLLSSLNGEFVTQRTSGYDLPAKLDRFVDCNASGDTLSDLPVQSERIACSAKAGLYVQQGMYSGDFDYSHQVITSAKLDAWRFARRLKNASSAGVGSNSSNHVAPFACKSNVVRLNGLNADLLVCARAYKLFDSLYDISARVISLNQATRGFSSKLQLNGVDFDAGMKFVNRYVNSIKWTP
jgi:serine protease Do